MVSPYSTFMSLMTGSYDALRNLWRLKKMGAVGAYGFFEALDYGSPPAFAVGGSASPRACRSRPLDDASRAAPGRPAPGTPALERRRAPSRAKPKAIALAQGCCVLVMNATLSCSRIQLSATIPQSTSVSYKNLPRLSIRQTQ